MIVPLATCFCSVTQSCPTLCDPHGLPAHQAALSFTISWSLLRLMSTESVMSSLLPYEVIYATEGLPRWHSGKESTCQCRRQEMWVGSLGWEDPPEEGLTTHCNILAWRIPWTEEPGGLQSIVLQSWTQLKRLGTHACTCYRR